MEHNDDGEICGLKVGDVVQTPDKIMKKVTEIVTSYRFDTDGFVYTLDEIQSQRWVAALPFVVTMQEIADRFGVHPDKLVISA